MSSSGELSRHLPPLAPHSFFQGQWVKDLKALIQKGLDWFGNFFPHEINKSNFSWESVYHAVVGLFLFFVIGLIILVLYLVFQKIRKNPGVSVLSFGNQLFEGDEITQSLARALQQKNYPLAFRLRWKIHLIRKQESPSKTPSEIYRDTAILSFSADQQYCYMFGNPPADDSVFTQYNSALESLEGTSA